MARDEAEDGALAVDDRGGRKLPAVTRETAAPLVVAP